MQGLRAQQLPHRWAPSSPPEVARATTRASRAERVGEEELRKGSGDISSPHRWGAVVASGDRAGDEEVWASRAELLRVTPWGRNRGQWGSRVRDGGEF